MENKSQREAGKRLENPYLKTQEEIDTRMKCLLDMIHKREYTYSEMEEITEIVDCIQKKLEPSNLESTFLINWYLAEVRFNEAVADSSSSPLYCDGCECDPCDCGWGTL